MRKAATRVSPTQIAERKPRPRIRRLLPAEDSTFPHKGEWTELVLKKQERSRFGHTALNMRVNVEPVRRREGSKIAQLPPRLIDRQWELNHRLAVNAASA